MCSLRNGSPAVVGQLIGNEGGRRVITGATAAATTVGRKRRRGGCGIRARRRGGRSSPSAPTSLHSDALFAHRAQKRLLDLTEHSPKPPFDGHRRHLRRERIQSRALLLQRKAAGYALLLLLEEEKVGARRCGARAVGEDG